MVGRDLSRVAMPSIGDRLFLDDINIEKQCVSTTVLISINAF